MHPFRLRREGLEHICTSAEATADTLRSQQLAVPCDCLPCSIGQPVTMSTSPWLAIGRVQRGDVSAADTYKPQPVASKPTRRSPDVNHLIADFQLSSIPFNERGSGDLAPPAPSPPPFLRGGKIAIPLQGAHLNAARLLDCSPSSSAVSGQNRNPLEISCSLLKELVWFASR
jgi:hypothetical protein